MSCHHVIRVVAVGFLVPLVAIMAPLRAQSESSVKVDAKTEQVINRGLKYLVKYQSPNGSWQGRNEKERHYPIAITAYALMAFQSAGTCPGKGSTVAKSRSACTTS